MDFLKNGINSNGVIEKIWEKRAIIFILLAIFLLGAGIRGHLLRYEYLFEYDAFYHARLIEDIVVYGHVQNPDPLVYYEIGGAQAQKTSLYHIAGAIFYNLLALGQSFNKDLLMQSIRIFSVIIGGLISVLMYFLGKETFNNKKIGLITAFIAAVCPAFAYRTMAGAQGDNSFGFLWMVIGFIFFVKAVKTSSLERKDLINAGLAGIFFGLMSMSWGMYILIPLILVIYIPFALVLIASKQEHSETGLKKNHAFVFLIKTILSMAIFHIMATLYGSDWITEAFTWFGRSIKLDYGLTAIIVFAGIIAAAIVSIFFISKQRKETKNLFWAGVILLLYFSLGVLFFTFFTVPDMHDRTAIASQVGEESNGNQFFGTKYNSLIVFVWISILVFPITIWFFNKEDSHTGIIFFMWVLITLFMAWYTLKFTFVFGLAIAHAAAIVSFIAFEGLKRMNIEKGLEAKILLTALFLLVVFGVGASARFFPDYIPFVDQNPAWKETINWINSNTPQDAKFFNWWNQGHILAFLTERKYSSDNRNQSYIANKTYAKFMVLSDANEAYTLITSKSPDLNFDSDYIILERDSFYQLYNFAFYLVDKVDTQSEEVKKFIEYSNIIGCSESGDNMSCNGNTITKQEFNLYPSKWTSNPTTFIDGKIPAFVYRHKNSIVVIGQNINNSNLAKVWFNSDETKNLYEEVFSNDEIKIIKVIKQ